MCPFCIEPHSPPSVCIEFGSIRFLNQRSGESKAPLSFLADQFLFLATIFPTDRNLPFADLCPCVSTNSRNHSPEQVDKKIPKRHTAVKSFLYRIFRHHVIDGDVFSDITDKFKETEILKPVVIVDYFSGLFSTIETRNFSSCAFWQWLWASISSLSKFLSCDFLLGSRTIPVCTTKSVRI